MKLRRRFSGRPAPKRVRDRSFSDKTGKTQGMKLRIKPPKTAVSSKVSDKLPER